MRLTDGRDEVLAWTEREEEAVRLFLARLRFDAKDSPEGALTALARAGASGLLYVVSGLAGAEIQPAMQALAPGSCALVYLGDRAPEGFTLPCYAVRTAPDLAAAMGGGAQ